jgi:broad specificity polyphosphatase/5'/3'-nucleotidase SurE
MDKELNNVSSDELIKELVKRGFTINNNTVNINISNFNSEEFQQFKILLKPGDTVQREINNKQNGKYFYTGEISNWIISEEDYNEYFVKIVFNDYNEFLHHRFRILKNI